MGVGEDQRRLRVWGCVALLWLTACGSSPGTEKIPPENPGAGADEQDAGEQDAGAQEVTAVPIAEGWERGLQHLKLRIDLKTLEAQARWRVDAAASATPCSWDVSGLSDVVVDTYPHEVRDGALHVALPAEEVEVTVRYQLALTDGMTGFMKSGGWVTWPYYCGNVFPCRTSPSLGVTWSVEITGLGPDQTTPNPSASDVPTPMFAVGTAVGALSYRSLGKTKGGLEVGVWHHADKLDATAAALKDVVKAASWLESVLGPYPLGDRVTAVAAPWPIIAYGGLEMHPNYHLNEFAMNDQLVHFHELVHGWFGVGVRIACWEDLVLSEGVADYLMVRLQAHINGPEAMTPMFDAFRSSVQSKVGTSQDVIVLPDGCGEVDVIQDGLSGKITYHKGALVLRAIAEEVGYDAVDASLGAFVKANVGKAARFVDLMKRIKDDTGFDPDPLVTDWLRSPGLPGSKRP